MRKKKEKADNVVLLPKKFIKYREIKQDEEKRKEYRAFGIYSVLESLIAVVFTLIIFAAANIKMSNPLLFILVEVVLYLLATAVPLVALGYAALDMILQFKLNKQTISYTALFFFIAALIGVIFIILGALKLLG